MKMDFTFPEDIYEETYDISWHLKTDKCYLHRILFLAIKHAYRDSHLGWTHVQHYHTDSMYGFSFYSNVYLSPFYLVKCAKCLKNVCQHFGIKLVWFFSPELKYIFYSIMRPRQRLNRVGWNWSLLTELNPIKCGLNWELLWNGNELIKWNETSFMNETLVAPVFNMVPYIYEFLYWEMQLPVVTEVKRSCHIT